MQEAETPAITLLLVDDHEIVRVGLRTLFGHMSGIRVVGEADSAASAIDAATRLQPAVVLMDVRLPDGSGVDACREIRAMHPETRVLLLTSYDDDSAMLAAVFAGACGYLLKEIGADALVRAVKAAAAGESLLNPSAASAVRERMQSMWSAVAPAHAMAAELSAQEQRVLALVAQGKTNKEIALALDLSAKTVKNYLSNVFHKLHISRRAQAAVIFSRHSLR